MEIHELNTFSGAPGANDFFAIDNGTDTGKISAETLFGPINTRIDNIITSPAPSAEEIVDARNVGGVIYPTLHDAINGAYENTMSLSDGLKLLKWIAGGSVSRTDGTITAESGWSYTPYIEVDRRIFHVLVSTSWGSSFNAFYDENQNFISSFAWSNNNGIVNVPNNAKYMRLSTESVYVPYIRLEGDINEALDIVAQIEKNVGTVNSAIVRNEYIDHSGVAVKYNGWSRTNFILCLDAVYIQFSNTARSDFNAFYDSEKRFIDYFTIIAGENFNVRVPEGAKYFILSNTDAAIQAEVDSIKRIAFADVNSKIDYLSNYEIPVVMNRGGYIDKETGGVVEFANWSYSDFVPFEGGLLIVSNTSEENGSTFNAFYDKNKNFICNFSIFPNTKNAEIVAPLNAKYFRYSTGSFHTPEISFYLEAKNIDYNGDILRLNDKSTVGQRIIQSKMHYNPFDGSAIDTKILTLSVLTDIHAFDTEFKRYIRFTNAYADYVDDKLCLGDVVRDNISQDFTYWSNNEDADDIMIVLGNHDASTNEDGRYVVQPAKTCYDKYFLGLINNWQVTQPAGAAENGLCYYYKDYPDYNIRLIVLDCMHYTDAQNNWLVSVLDSARAEGLHVVCAKHYNVSRDLVKISGNFYDPDLGFTKLVIGDTNNNKAQLAVNAFQSAGGIFVCWLTGDAHYDAIGELTVNGIKQLCVTFENAGCHDAWGDAARVVGQKSEDSFNFVTVDAYSHLLKIVRIGNDMNRFLQPKKYLCYNYQTNEVISVE